MKGNNTEMEEMEKQELLDRLVELTKDMDIPEFRRKSIPWLNRNMAIRNSDHPNYQEAKGIVDTLMKMGVTS